MGGMDAGNSASLLPSSAANGGGGGDGGGDYQGFEESPRGRSDSSTMSTLFSTTSMPLPMTSFGNTVPYQLYSLTNSSSSFDVHNFDPSNTFSQSSSPGNNFMINHTNHHHNNNNNNNNNDDGDNRVNMVWPNKYGSFKPSTSSFLDDANCTTGLASSFTHTTTNNNPVQPVSVEKPPSDHPGGGGGAGRNPKKRTRATRKAPTTVLTTDTNNFRQMVQEFTGIPSPPFTAAFQGGRTRLDLFGGLGIQFARAAPNPNPNVCSSSDGLLHSPPYLLRPSPHKIVVPPQSIPTQPHPFCSVVASSSPSINSINKATTDTVDNPIPTFQSLPQYSLPDFQQDSVACLNSPKASCSLPNQLAFGCAAATAAAAAATTTATTIDTSVIGGGDMSAIGNVRLQAGCSVNNNGGREHL